MNRLGQAFVALVFLLLAEQAWAVSVIEGPVTYGGHQYYLLSGGTWFDAEATAVALGGHLATINNAAENSFLFSTFTANGTLNRHMWIGLNDAASEGTFVWVSGEPVTYTNWDVGEPNNAGGGEDYVHFLSPFASPGGVWNDLPGTQTNLGIAEVNLVPEPSTIVLLASGLAGLVGARRWRKNRLK